MRTCFLLRSLRTLLRTTDSRKESRCLSCYPIQLSKNRLPSKGRPFCRSLPSVSSGKVSLPQGLEPLPSDADTSTDTRLSGLERSNYRGPQILGSDRCHVKLQPGTVTTLVYRGLFPTSGLFRRCEGTAPQSHRQRRGAFPYSIRELAQLVVQPDVTRDIKEPRFAASESRTTESA